MCLFLSRWPKQVTRASPVSGCQGTTQGRALILWLEGKGGPWQLQMQIWGLSSSRAGLGVLLSILRDAFSPPHFPSLLPPGLGALLDWDKSGLGMCSPLVVGSGSDFKHPLSWDPKPSPHESSHRSADSSMRHTHRNIFSMFAG